MGNFEIKLGKATRDAYGEALLELGKKYSDIIVLDADLSKSTKSIAFAKAFPERFINCGIAEANMVSMAAGLANAGFVPFASSFASFLMCKAFDQIRMSIANPLMNVKLVGSHGGISLGEDGASQQAVEDISLACSLPGLSVIVPSDEFQTRAITKLAYEHKGPLFIRTGRPKAPVIYSNNETFEIGKAKILRQGKDATIIAIGLLVAEALLAADKLREEGIEVNVVDMFTVKPIDKDIIVDLAKKTGAIVTAEEHLIGGLSSQVSMVLVNNYPVPVEFVGINDTYSESGKPEELMEKYGLTYKDIIKAVKKVLTKKVH
ncbi:MAG: transketolase [Candidatus Sericytochromatia bacterium]|nr:MAG: transketolase [Candidatus Sericytochromatia bacterium]